MILRFILVREINYLRVENLILDPFRIFSLFRIIYNFVKISSLVLDLLLIFSSAFSPLFLNDLVSGMLTYL